MIGVDTADTRAGAASVVRDLGIGVPGAVRPRTSGCGSALGRSVLPVTVFVAADGSIRYLHDTSVLAESEIARLVRTYLGVGHP